jgi:hypothetical protein
MRDPRPLVVLVLLLLVVLVARRWIRAVPALPPSMRLRGAVAVAAAAFTMALTVWVWGGLRAPAVVDDEAAYVLQADLFAHGRWTRPSPLPSLSFTQPAVLVTPVLAPKMPPGHALLLAPGALIGLPGLIPVLLSGATAALLVLLVCEVQSPAVAVLTVIVWLTFAGQMRWRASYFSEITTGMLWLLGWWALLRWRQTRRTGWLLLLATAIGWGAITRPLTMLAFALPIGIVVLRDVIRGKHWRQLAGAMAVGVACLALLPIQNYEVLGNWRESPLALYTSEYMPFDRIGFGFDSTPPSLGLPDDLQAAQLPIMARHREHQPSALPRVLATRLWELRMSTFGGWRVLWIPAAMVGAAIIGASGWFAIASGLTLYLAYLLYAHEPHWTVYYLEAAPAAAFVCATGLAWLLARATAARRELPLATAAMAALAILAAGWRELHTARTFRAGAQKPFRALEHDVAATGIPHALVFIRNSVGHDPSVNFVRNVADAARAPILTAYDRGPADKARTMAHYPDRAVLYWDGDLTHLVGPTRDTLP